MCMVCTPPSSFTSLRATFAPSCAKRRAAARPWPLAPPVINATFSASLPAIIRSVTPCEVVASTPSRRGNQHDMCRAWLLQSYLLQWWERVDWNSVNSVLCDPGPHAHEGPEVHDWSIHHTLHREFLKD